VKRRLPSFLTTKAKAYIWHISPPQKVGQLKRLGLSAAPKLAIGDGSLGFWIALQEEYGPIAQQRCWVHKTANVLDKMPKSVQGKAKQLIHEMYLAPTRKAALAAYDQFISSYQVKFPKACECLQKDKEVLFTFWRPFRRWRRTIPTGSLINHFNKDAPLSDTQLLIISPLSCL
jgi:putative transposase